MNNQEKKQEKEIEELIKEEKELVKEVKKFEKGLWITTGLIALAIIVLAGGLIYWRLTNNQIYIENSDIEAPAIALAPTISGTLEEVYVHEGDDHFS